MSKSKLTRRKFLKAAGLTTAGTMLANCTPPATSAPAATAAPVATEVPMATEAPKPTVATVAVNKTLNLNMAAYYGDPGAGVDPGCSGGAHTILVDQLLFSSLVYFDKDMVPQPDCAESWSINKDSTVWTFKLRKDLKWTDGTAITAKDFEWTVKRNSGPDMTCNPGAQGIVYMLDVIKGVSDYANKITTTPDGIGVKALDDYTLEFTMNEPSGYFIQMAQYTTYAPLPRKAIEDFGKDTKWIRPEHILSNGPFKLTEWVQDQQMTLVANTNWHGYGGNAPTTDKIVIKMIKSEATAIAAYETGELDVIEVPSGELARVTKDAKLGAEVHPFNDLLTQYMIIPIGSKPFDDIRVRHALSMAIDREILSKAVLQGAVSPAYQILPPTMLGYDAQLNSELQYNPDKAKQLLADAGFPGGKGFPSFFINSNATDQYQTMFEAIQAMFKEVLGINMELALMDAGARGKWRDDKPYKLHLWRERWGMDFPDSHNTMSFMVASKQKNLKTNADHPEFEYKNTKFTDLVGQAAKEVDAKKRAEMYKQADRILCFEDPAIIPIYYALSNLMIKPRVSGYWLSGMGINYRNVAVTG